MDWAQNAILRYHLQVVHIRAIGSRGFNYNYYFNQATGRGFLDLYSPSTNMIYDFKFGNAIMNEAQFLKYSSSFPNATIKIVRP